MFKIVNPIFPLTKQIVHCPAKFILAIFLMLSMPFWSWAQTSVSRRGNAVVLQNGLVKIEYNLSKGTYSVYSLKDKTSNLIGPTLQINDYTSDSEGLTRTCQSNAINDELGSGQKLTVTSSGKGDPDLILELSLYDGKSFVVMNDFF